jgi:hypothetical protein
MDELDEAIPVSPAPALATAASSGGPGGNAKADQRPGLDCGICMQSCCVYKLKAEFCTNDQPDVDAARADAEKRG